MGTLTQRRIWRNRQMSIWKKFDQHLWENNTLGSNNMTRLQYQNSYIVIDRHFLCICRENHFLIQQKLVTRDTKLQHFEHKLNKVQSTMSEETTTVYQSCSTQFNTTDGLDGLLQCIADGSAAVRCVVCVRVLFCLFVFACVLSLSLSRFRTAFAWRSRCRSS